MKKAKKIVLFNNALTGGGGRYIITLAKTLKKMGIDVHIIIYENKIDFELPDTLPLHLLKNHHGEKKNILRRLTHNVESLEPIDLIVSNSSPSNKILSQMKHPQAVHCVHSAETKEYHGFLAPLKNRWRKEKYRHLYNGKNIITVSQGLKSFLLDDLKANPKSIRTIYNPFDFEEIQRASLETFPEIPSEPYIVHVGRFDTVSKRHDILLQAYSMANIPHKLVMVGEGKDRNLIKKWIQEYRLEKKVIMAGFQANPYSWIARADLLVSSSDFEGFGRTLVEALILKIPVVSTDCPSGPSDILTGELATYLSPPGDSEKLAKNINKALYEYPKIEEKFIERFDSNIIAEEYSRLADSRWLYNCIM
ncbi:glycosyltransferase [Nitratifractor sp.]